MPQPGAAGRGHWWRLGEESRDTWTPGAWVLSTAHRIAWLRIGDLPVLLIDEAQEARTDVLCELRLLASAELDASAILTVVFAGDGQLPHKLRAPALLPLESRLRVKLL